MKETRQSIGRKAHLRSSARGAGRGVAAGFLGGGLLVAFVAVFLALPHAAVAVAAGDQSEGSGLPLPRFASLKSDHVNVRGGPNKDHDVAWVYTRPALPVEITAEFENWRKIRDRDGSEGWVYHTLLSGRRTAFVALPKIPQDKIPQNKIPQDKSQYVGVQQAAQLEKAQPDLVPLHATPESESPPRAMLEPGVLGTVRRCTGQWCHFAGADFDGWIEQSSLWGVYLNEKIE
jgi:SH3-like domain-containing protein